MIMFNEMLFKKVNPKLTLIHKVPAFVLNIRIAAAKP